MSIMTFDRILPQNASWEIRWDRLPHPPRAAWALVLALAILIGGNQLSVALQSPGQAIKSALAAAAADMVAPSGPEVTTADLDAVGRHFSNQTATLDAKYWPQVAVTLHGVDKSSCVEAAAIADRIEGLVVVQLQSYRSAADCGASNDMTWWILP